MHEKSRKAKARGGGPSQVGGSLSPFKGHNKPELLSRRGRSLKPRWGGP